MKMRHLLALTCVPLVGIFAATALAAPQPKVDICHKYDTPDQASITVGYPAMSTHILNHGDYVGICPDFDKFIDVDGITTPFMGALTDVFIDVAYGDTLTAWPTGFYTEGIDWFDNDGTCTWTMGDDLHLERTGTCTTGIGNGIHELGLDCVVLDIDASLYDGQQVDVDLESETTFTGCPGVDPLLMFFDTDGNGYYDEGEDVVLDANGNGIFD
ncbi:MAG: hypothetical protein KJO33_07825 [Gammaproteobacteria bacterium]|nr:hypothetical protein [Gammaproteobacteria bacterium]